MFVKDLNDKTHMLMINKGKKILKIKEMIEAITGLRVAEQRLIFGGKVLESSIYE